VHEHEGSDLSPGGVIWVTGYSSAGKTSLGRLVASRLDDVGTPSVFLDGDDLRGIFGKKWGYTDEERRELARVYFRLCSHIASQGVTVVIAAAAMYSSVYAWFKQNVFRGMLVYLDVPEAVRRSRDAATKGVYDDVPCHLARYEIPAAPDLTLENPDGSDLHRAAARVVEQYEALRERRSDRGRAEHWDSFYAQGKAPLNPSPFAVHVRELLSTEEPSTLLEVGCGNGRDAAYFAQAGLEVTALDKSAAAIAFCREVHGDGIAFEHAGSDGIDARANAFDVVYSRFVLHAMTLDEEEAFLATAGSSLRPGGRLFVECRSIQDPLAREGEVLSPTERIHGHYRRFIVADELVDRVEAAGLKVEAMTESTGLAVLGDEDPVVVRLIASKSP
jgi:bifunctional enzyme CysN/CysC